jgi:DNA-binding transcriptional regulator/RsmH inhibitor MraZ
MKTMKMKRRKALKIRKTHNRMIMDITMTMETESEISMFKAQEHSITTLMMTMNRMTSTKKKRRRLFKLLMSGTSRTKVPTEFK